MRLFSRTVARVSLALGTALVVPAAFGADTVLHASRVASTIPLIDPAAPVWSKAREVAVVLQPQSVVVPMNPEPAVTQIQVRAVHNGKLLAVRINWKDATRSETVLSDTFGDQVAVEFPIRADPADLPSPMMGNAGAPVNILQWRAALQHDLDYGDPSVRTLYSNAEVDVYPDQLLPAAVARPYQGAMAVDNPVSRPMRTPVLDQVAEGWGTLTTKAQSRAEGRGVWHNGVWSVVITLPLASTSQDAPNLRPGQKTSVAFAVWEGGHREVGSRKSWSDWTAIELAK